MSMEQKLRLALKFADEQMIHETFNEIYITYGKLVYFTISKYIENSNDIEDLTQYKANKYYTYENGEYIISNSAYNENKQYYVKDVVLEQEDLKLKDIIREAVHVYGKELYHNIIINDLDDYGLELLEYRGDTPIYMLREYNSDVFTNITINKN